jgi:hypothetical protein
MTIVEKSIPRHVKAVIINQHFLERIWNGKIFSKDGTYTRRNIKLLKEGVSKTGVMIPNVQMSWEVLPSKALYFSKFIIENEVDKIYVWSVEFWTCFLLKDISKNDKNC